MKHLHDPTRVTELTARIAQLRSDSPRQWGKMTPSQAVAHMAIGFEAALGDIEVPRLFIGRLIGGFVKRSALGNDAPIMKNAPTAPELHRRRPARAGTRTPAVARAHRPFCRRPDGLYHQAARLLWPAHA